MTILWLVVLAFAAYGAGAPLVRLLRGWETPAGGIMALFLGAGSMGLLAMLGNAAGLLPRPVAIGLLAVVAFVGVAQAWRDRAKFVIHELRWEDWAGLGLLLCLYGWLVSWSWIPWLYVDSYSYHFTTPKQWLMEGRLRAVPYEAHSNFYMIWSGWLFWAIALETDNFLLPRQMVTGTLFLLALLLALEIRRSTGSRIAAWSAGAFWMVTLEALEIGTTDFMELPMATMLLITVLALRDSLELPVGHDRWRGLVLAGIAAGLTMGLKATGLAMTFCLGIALLVLLAMRREGWRPFLIGASCYGFTALLVWSPWAIKSAYLTGNPFYPFLLSLFGAGPEYLQVALDFHRFYKPDPENYSAIRNLIDYLDLYRRNIAYLDPNRIVLVFVLTALPLLAHLRSLAPKRRSLLMIALFLLPLAVLLPARRFQLVAFVVLYLSAVETMAVWFSTQVARYGQMLRGAAFLVLIALFVQRVQYAHEARIPSLVREHSWIEVKPYLTVRAMEESVYTRYPGWPAVVWLEANLPKEKRVLVTGHMMLSSMADVRLLNNMHIHGENALVIMTEDQGVELDQLLDILRGWDIGAIHTETAFDRNPVLQELHDGWLDRVLDANGYTLYVLREERR